MTVRGNVEIPDETGSVDGGTATDVVGRGWSGCKAQVFEGALRFGLRHHDDIGVEE